MAAVFAPLLAKYDPDKIAVEDALIGPGSKHILGTDQLGRHLYRMLLGPGVFIGWGDCCKHRGFSGPGLGFFGRTLGGIIDQLIMRFVDIMLGFPAFF